MDFFQRYLQGKIVLIIAIVFLCISNVFSVCYFLNRSEKKEECICEDCSLLNDNIENIEEVEKIKVDIKGYVKKPGVYELDSGTIVNDLIKKAGGLKTNGTTENINLSKKLNDEDMIVVLSKTELKKQKTSTSTTSNTSVTSSQSEISTSSSSLDATNKKVSINTASKEELMTLNGIGESKALAIIEYRTNAPFQTIEEVQNVSGIGESVYEKIKDFITI